SLREFALEPSALQVPAGRPVRLEVTNTGSAQHALSVQVGGEKDTASMLNAGGVAALGIPPPEGRADQKWCPVPGHKDAGMSGSLVAGAATSASDGSGTSDGMAGMSGTSSSHMSAQQMADMHEASTKAFPAKTAGAGDQILQPTVSGGVK